MSLKSDRPIELSAFTLLLLLLLLLHLYPPCPPGANSNTTHYKNPVHKDQLEAERETAEADHVPDHDDGWREIFSIKVSPAAEAATEVGQGDIDSPNV